MPAKDALVPNLVPKRLLARDELARAVHDVRRVPARRARRSPASSVSPRSSATTSSPLRSLGCSQENLALWIDTATFIASALIVSRVTRAAGAARAPSRPARRAVGRARRGPALPARARRGRAGDAIDRDQPRRRRRRLLARRAVRDRRPATAARRRSAAIVAALGTGMGVGVLVLGFIGDRLPKAWLASGAVIFAGTDAARRRRHDAARARARRRGPVRRRRGRRVREPVRAAAGDGRTTRCADGSSRPSRS